MTTINIKKHLYRLATCLFAATLFTCEKVPEYCRPSGEWYDPDYQFCFEGKARKQCSDGKYNPLTEGCDAQNLVGTMCADGSFVRRGSPCGGYTLSVGSAPASGGTVTSSHPGKTTFAAGDEVTLDAMPEEGYAFIGWAGAKNTADRAVTLPMNANVSLIAMFSPKSATGAATHTLVTAAFPEYGGTVSVNGATPANSGTTTHNAGTRPTVTAAPNPGYAFTGWSGASTSKSAAVTAAMDSSQTLVAIFTPNVYTLTVNSAPKEGGAVFLNGTAQTGTTDQYAETEIIALAKPAEGYSFAGWTGTAAETVGIDIEADSVKINLTGGNMTLTANFRKGGGPGPGPHPPSGSSSVAFNANGGSPTPATQTVTNGGKATKPANPTYEGYRFIGWYLNAEFTVEWDFGINVVYANVTLYAKWETYVPPMIVGDTLVDLRDGQSYRMVTIGTQTWMAENLNYVPSSGFSMCYSNLPDNCAKYGRLYDRDAAMKACPSGWRLPDTAEWRVLVNYAGGGSVAGKTLKSATGWNGFSGITATNEYGFSALPGGCHYCSAAADTWVGDYGYWWSAPENGSGAYRWSMAYDNDNVVLGNGYSGYSYSVRCVQNQ